MGKSIKGGDTRMPDINLLTPDQQAFLAQTLGGQGQLAGDAYKDFLQPYDQEKFKELFQKSYIDPAQQALQREVIPGIKENFLGLDESGSSALNRALAQSATDVATGLGSQYMNQYNQQQANRLSALSGLGGLSGQRTFSPHIQQQSGILGPLIGGFGQGISGLFRR